MRRTVVALSFAAALCACGNPAAGQPADSAWPMFRRDARHTGASPHAGPSVPLLSWSYRVGDEIGDSSPALGPDGRVYVAPNSGVVDKNLYAVDAQGGLAWSYRIGAWNSSSPAVASSGDVYVGTGSFRVYALRSNGTLGWSYRAGSNVNSSPCIGADGGVYVGSSDNRLYALDPDGSLRWSYRTANYVDSSPALGGAGGVYVGSGDNRVYAFDSNGSLRWSFKTEDAVSSSPAVGADGIYVGSQDHRVYALGLNGAFRWSYDTGWFVFSSPALGPDETVYAGSRNYRFFALGSDGSVRWSYEAGDCVWSSAAIGSDGGVYFASWDDNVYALDSAGVLAWSYGTASSVYSSPAIGADGRIYVGSTDNTLYCIGPTPTPTPTITPTPPIDLTADKTEYGTTDAISVTADVWPLTVPCHPFVRVLMADGRTLYYERGRGFTDSPTPYLGFARGPLTVAAPIADYQALSAGFREIEAGEYVLEGGAVDMTRTTSADALFYFGTVDRETLTVR